MSVGKRIYLRRNLPDPKLVEEFKKIPASNIADTMGRNSAMNARIHLVSRPKAQIMAGPAFTVKLQRRQTTWAFMRPSTIAARATYW